MKRFILTIILILMVIPAPIVLSQDADELVYMMEDYPPANYLGKNGELKGASVEILKLMWKKMGYPEQPIKVYPWARGYNMVQTEKNHVLFTMSRSPERENMFKWVGPIFTAKHVLIGLADKKIELNSLEDAKKYRIGTIRDDIGEQSLLKAGFDRDKIESVSKLEINIKKLLKGRVDFISQAEDAVRDFIELNNYDPKIFKVFFMVNQTGNYYAFQKDTPDALIQKFQAAFDSIEAERMEILKNYKMSP